MLISEQKYSNLNKVYYRGLKNLNDSRRKYDEIYLTTKFLYALANAGLDGIVRQYTLRKSANIFNMKCRTDEAALRRYCQQSGELAGYTKLFDQLKENDWSYITGGDYYRQRLVWAIRKLGYDGYFNFEIDEDYQKKCSGYSWSRLSELQIKSPAVAVFDEASLVRISELRGEELRDFYKTKQAKEIEKEYILKKRGNVQRHLIVSLTDDEFRQQVELAKSEKNRMLQEELDRLLVLNSQYRDSAASPEDIKSFIKSTRFLKDERDYFRY